MNTVKIIPDALNPLLIEVHQCAELLPFLVAFYGSWPSNARIFHKEVSLATDVTPSTTADVEHLANLSGTFYIVHYPAGGATRIISAVVAVVAVVVAALFVASASASNATLRNTQSSSPTNELAERTNEGRPLERIPDIYGTVRSTPDLLGLPFKVFKNHEELEIALLAVGRGYYTFADFRDDTTLVSDIAGASIRAYAPFTSPNFGTPQVSIGDPINWPILSCIRANSVNGQVIRPPNDVSLTGNQDIWFTGPNEIHCSSDDYDFTDYFAAGDTLRIEQAITYTDYVPFVKSITPNSSGSFTFAITGGVLPVGFAAGLDLQLTGALFTITNLAGDITDVFDLSGIYNIGSAIATSSTVATITLIGASSVNPDWAKADGTLTKDVGIRVADDSALYDLDGEYVILSVGETLITLSNPSAIKPDWGIISTTTPDSPILSTSGDKWVGPFTVDKKDTDHLICNFIALNGLYKDDGRNQRRMDVNVEFEATQIDAAGAPVALPILFSGLIEGSATYRSTRAITLEALDLPVGRYSVRARRTTETDLKYQGSVVDEIKWRDLYACSTVTAEHFGNITTIHSAQYATAGALTLKERKLNCLVTRNLPTWDSEARTFTEDLNPTNNLADIFCALSLDPYLGRRKLAELDIEGIYQTQQDIVNYFGSSKAAEFCYTFDNLEMSYEEMAASVAAACFCTAYRRGNVIKLHFEKKTDAATLLFNHRNKIPETEVRTLRFGNENNYDGVNFEWIDPEDEALVTLYIPEDMSAVNPNTIESVGVRNKLQAHMLAWRAYNKIRYQNLTIEFDATHEADILLTNERILVADNTRPNTQDGEIVAVDGLECTSSQPLEFDDFSLYQCFLQLADGTIQSIPCSAGTSNYTFVLAEAPLLPLVTGLDTFARTTFVISKDSSAVNDVLVLDFVNDKYYTRTGVVEATTLPFLVTEKAPKENFVTSLTAVNYSDRYYTQDSDYLNNVIDEDGNIL